MPLFSREIAMNSFERYAATIAGKPVDFLPRVPILMQFAAEYIGSNYGAFAADYRVLAEANLRCRADFGFEQVSCISDPYRETQGFGAEVEYLRDSVPRCLAHPLELTKDLSSLKAPDPLASERMRDRVEAAREMRRRVGREASVLGWIEGPGAEAADLRGVMNFLIDTMDDVPFCRELMDRCVEVGIAFAEAQIAAGADTVGIGDAIASQVTPDFYHAEIQPREARLVRAIQAKGAWAKLHICGDITHLLPGIAKLGVDILDVDHMVDLAAVRAAVGPRVVIAGNADPVAVVSRGTPQGIRAALAQCYAVAGNPFMVNAGCEIPPGTPPANLHAFCEPLAYRP
jgi:MtaA/CmuA family methyltransferase